MTVPDAPTIGATGFDVSKTATTTGSHKKKLYGRAFYESLGSPKRIVAPMVDASELAWRILSRKFNTDAAYSPMLHARMFAEMPSYRSQALRPQPSENDPHPKASYDGDTQTDRPLLIQFCANDPDHLLNAAKIAQHHCDAIDLNLGCPQGIAKKGNYGSFLQESPGLIYKMINRLHLELDVPVTAKIRILDTKEDTLEYAKMILDAGASILTIHGRRREQKGHNTGLADWQYIRYLRDNLPLETVILANGNILYNTDIEACLQITGADGVMSAEANPYNPAIFMPVTASFEEQFPRIDHVSRDYLEIVRSVVFGKDGDSSDIGASVTSQHASLIAMKSHMFRLLHAVFRHKEHHYIREILAKSSGKTFSGYERVVAEVEKVVKAQLERTPEDPKDWDEIMEGSGKVGEEAKILPIPWWRCQPYVRPTPEEAKQKGALKESKKDRRAKEKENKRHLEEESVEVRDLEPVQKKLKADTETEVIRNNEHTREIDNKVAG